MDKMASPNIGVFFEVTPKPGHLDNYFSYVEKLKDELAKQEGLLWLQRYNALFDNNTLLSHQLWDHQDSIVAWRQNKAHRSAQIAGIKAHFQNYRIRIGKKLKLRSIQDLALFPTATALNGKLLLSVHSSCPLPNAIWHDCELLPFAFSSVIDSHDIITLSTINNMSQAISFSKTISLGLIDKAELFLINRDYGMFDRDQTPSHDRKNDI